MSSPVFHAKILVVCVNVSWLAWELTCVERILVQMELSMLCGASPGGIARVSELHLLNSNSA